MTRAGRSRPGYLTLLKTTVKSMVAKMPAMEMATSPTPGLRVCSDDKSQRRCEDDCNQPISIV
jgi:hypothetical protein